MKKVCRRCGGEFFGHFNARFCGEECRALAKRAYLRAYHESHRKPPKPPEFIPPFPDDIDWEGFGHWLSGFVDGEATFGLRLTPGFPRAFFRIVLRDDDSETLQLIRSYWSCGVIYHQDNARSKIPNAKPIATFSVQKVTDLVRTIVPHFDRFPLRAKKRNHFAVWRRGVAVLAEVQSRPLIGRYGRGGTEPRWTGTERERFRALSDELTAQRRYEPAAD